jgi:hypothetical protein
VVAEAAIAVPVTGSGEEEQRRAEVVEEPQEPEQRMSAVEEAAVQGRRAQMLEQTTWRMAFERSVEAAAFCQ